MQWRMIKTSGFPIGIKINLVDPCAEKNSYYKLVLYETNQNRRTSFSTVLCCLYHFSFLYQRRYYGVFMKFWTLMFLYHFVSL